MLTASEKFALRLCLTVGCLIGSVCCGGPPRPLTLAEEISEAPACPSVETAPGWSGMEFQDCAGPPYTGQRCVAGCQQLQPDGSLATLPPGCTWGAPGYGPALCVASCSECPP